MGEPAYDLVLCRNVLIYLTPEGRAQAVANLDHLLAPDGRLGLTPAEADRLPPGRFTPDGPVAMSMYRRSGPEAAAPSKSAALSLPPSRRVEKPALVGWVESSRPTTAGAASLEDSTHPTESTPPDPAHLARELADAGRLDEARAACEAAIGAAPPTSALLGLLGVIHLAAGRRGEATDAFRKALYLDPDDADALAHMIVLSEQHGDRAQADRFRRRLERGEREARA